MQTIFMDFGKFFERFLELSIDFWKLLVQLDFALAGLVVVFYRDIPKFWFT